MSFLPFLWPIYYNHTYRCNKFSIDLKVLFYHYFRPLLTPFFPFLWPINYNHTYRCNKFSMDLKVLFYHGSRPLLTPFFSFPWFINYNHASQCNNFFTHSSLIWFWLKLFFLFLNSWHRVWPHLMGLMSHEWLKNHLGNYP